MDPEDLYLPDEFGSPEFDVLGGRRDVPTADESFGLPGPSILEPELEPPPPPEVPDLTLQPTFVEEVEPPPALPPPTLPPAVQPVGIEPPPPLPPPALPTLLDAPELTPVQITGGELEVRGRRLDALTNSLVANRTRAEELREEAQTATPERQAEIAGALAELGGTQERLLREQSQLRLESGELAAVGQTQLAARAAELQAVAMRDAEAEAARVKADSEAKRAKAEADRAAAVTRLEEDKAAYRKALATEPKMSIFGVMSIINEAFAAGIEDRPPNFDKAMAAAQEDARARARDRVARALAAVNLSQDELGVRAAAQAEVAAQERAAILEIYTQAETRLQKDMDSARAPLERAQLAQQLDSVRQQREAAESAAMGARADAARKAEAADVELDLKRAQIRKEQAAATKTEAEAARLQRRGTGGQSSARPGLLAPNVATYPDSDVPLVKFPDTPEGRKEAAVVRRLVAGQSKGLNRINKALALYEDADSRGILESAGWDRSGNYSELDHTLTMLRSDLALVKADGGMVTADDDDWARTLVPESPKAWSSRRKAMAELNALRTIIEDEVRARLSGETRLDKETREFVIGASRPKSVSKSDLAERERKQASRDLVSPTTSSDRKVTAVAQIEAEARKRAKDEGDEKDWLPQATAELSAALSDPNVFNDKRAAGAIRAKLREYEKFALERVDSETPAAMTRSLTTSVGAAPGSARHRTAGQLDEAAIERHAAIAERARVAALKLDIREASPAQRQVMRRFPGMAPLVDEVEIEEAAISTPKTGEEK